MPASQPTPFTRSLPSAIIQPVSHHLSLQRLLSIEPCSDPDGHELYFEDELGVFRDPGLGEALAAVRPFRLCVRGRIKSANRIGTFGICVPRPTFTPLLPTIHPTPDLNLQLRAFTLAHGQQRVIPATDHPAGASFEAQRLWFP